MAASQAHPPNRPNFSGAITGFGCTTFSHIRLLRFNGCQSLIGEIRSITTGSLCACGNARAVSHTHIVRAWARIPIPASAAAAWACVRRCRRRHSRNIVANFPASITGWRLVVNFTRSSSTGIRSLRRIDPKRLAPDAPQNRALDHQRALADTGAANHERPAASAPEFEVSAIVDIAFGVFFDEIN